MKMLLRILGIISLLAVIFRQAGDIYELQKRLSHWEDL